MRIAWAQEIAGVPSTFLESDVPRPTFRADAALHRQASTNPRDLRRLHLRSSTAAKEGNPYLFADRCGGLDGESREAKRGQPRQPSSWERPDGGRASVHRAAEILLDAALLAGVILVFGQVA